MVFCRQTLQILGQRDAEVFGFGWYVGIERVTAVVLNKSTYDAKKDCCTKRMLRSALSVTALVWKPC